VRETLAVNLEELATKQDLRELKQDLRELEVRLEAKLKDTEARLEAKIDTKIAAVQQDLAVQKADIVWLKWLTGAIAVGMLAQLFRSFGVL